MENSAPSIRRIIKLGANAVLTPFGYEIRKKISDLEAEKFPAYSNEAKKVGMDVNDWEEQVLGWPDKALPILEQTVFPYLQEDFVVCNLGVGTGRWARHVAPKLVKGELHLVDYSPWIVEFVRGYFHANPRAYVHLNDGYSFPFWDQPYLDLIFSFGTFIALKLGGFYRYSREFFRVLKPGGYCIIEYIDVTRPEGWNWLETQSVGRADCYTYYSPEMVERVFLSAGFKIVKRHDIGRGTYLAVGKPST